MAPPIATCASEVLDQVRKYGAVVLRGSEVGMDAALNLVQDVLGSRMIRLGCPVWQRGYNEHGLTLHTDGADAPPVFDLLILHCVQSAAQGGESILCDAGKLYNALKDDASLCWVVERLTTSIIQKSQLGGVSLT
jgi:hypothetical protein